MEKFVLACAQFAIAPNRIRENAEKCCAWIERAVKEHGARFIVLPETITTGFSPGMSRDAFYELVEPLDGPSVRSIGRVAKAHGVWVLLPVYERGPERPIIYNTAVLLDDKGEIFGVYRKTHPFPTERLDCGGWTTAGTDLPVFDVGFAKFGVTICYEGDFPELSRILALKGADVILRPAALLRSFEIWDLTNRARAYDNHVYVAGANAVGHDAGGHHYFGHSMIVNPIAQKIAQARGVEEVVAAEIEPDPVRYVTYGSKDPMVFDHLEDRNVEIYDRLLLHEWERVTGPAPSTGGRIRSILKKIWR